MKFISCIFIFSALAIAQPPQRLIFVTSDPSGACNNSQALRYNPTSGNLFGCSGTWKNLSNGGVNGVSIATVTLSAAQVTAMSVTPIMVVPAPGAGNIVRVLLWTVNGVFGSSAFAGGGSIGIFYSSAAPNLANEASSNLIGSTYLTSFSTNFIGGGAGNLTVNAIPTSVAINAPVYFGNVTAPFTGGTGCSLIVIVQYQILAAQ